MLDGLKNPLDGDIAVGDMADRAGLEASGLACALETDTSSVPCAHLSHEWRAQAMLRSGERKWVGTDYRF